MTRHHREISPPPTSKSPGREASPPGARPGRPSPVENLITCPKCGFVYDTRFLAEHCRMVNGEGYHCYHCNTLLVSI